MLFFGKVNDHRTGFAFKMVYIAYRKNQAYLLGQAGAPIFLSGGFGSEVNKVINGNTFETGAGAYIAALDAPYAVKHVHAAYAEAGADILTADTFSTSSYRLNHQEDLAGRAIREACRLAGKFVRRTNGKVVMASLTSLEDCYDPLKTPDQNTLYREHFKTIRMVAAQKDVALMAETLPTLLEARVIAELAQKNGVPFFACFVVDEQGNVLDGSSMEDIVEDILEPYGLCLGVGVNCCTVEGAFRAVEALDRVYKQKAITGKHIVAFPNGFVKSYEENMCACDAAKKKGHMHEPEVYNTDVFATILEDLFLSGASVLGGCCGTTPEHTAAYSRIRLSISLEKKTKHAG